MSIVNITKSQTLCLMLNVFPSLLPTTGECLGDRLTRLPHTVTLHDHLAFEAIVKIERFLTNYDAPPWKKGKAAETVWLQRKRMPYFSDSRSRLRTEQEDGPAEILADYVAIVCAEVLIL